ncbi:MAG: hypothetical protein A2Y07_03170 [Planctomycetes bacterium GWF2_50_10]|nr:MAG: hypothetical protein A2Y07_03170 [Planctomycetes bacterium GWF2_50_10]
MFSKVACTVLLSLALASVSFAWTTPVLMTELSTPYGDWAPSCISDDGLTVYFTRGGTSSHYWNQLYMATRPTPSGQFTNVHIINDLACGEHETQSWVSSNGLKMYFARTWRIKLSTRATPSSPWSSPQNLTSINAFGSVANPELSADELTIVFNVFPSGTTRLMYTANRNNVNSEFGNFRLMNELSGVDVTPNQLSSDGLTLYFNRNDGGMSHVYQSTRPSITGIFGVPQRMDFPDGYGVGCFSSDYHTAYLQYNADIYVSYDNTAPTASAGPDQLVYAGINGMAAVTLDGSASNDPQNDELEYIWAVDGQVCEANGVKPTLNLPAGTHTITLVVNDGEFDSQADEVIVEVVAPLKINMKLSPVLHSPSKKLLVARFDFPSDPVGKIDPYSIALAADPNITADYIDLAVHKDSILNCNIAFESASIPSGLLTLEKKVVIFGCFKNGRLFYGEDNLVRSHHLK